MLTHSAAVAEDSAALLAAGFAALLIAALLAAANSLLAFALGRSSKPEAAGFAALLAVGFVALLEAALLMLPAAPAASSLLAFAQQYLGEIEPKGVGCGSKRAALTDNNSQCLTVNRI